MNLRDVMIDSEVYRLRRRKRRREYWFRHGPRLNARARHQQQMRYWTGWLLRNLEWPVEPTPIYPDPYPIRRPTLRLPQRVT